MTAQEKKSAIHEAMGILGRPIEVAHAMMKPKEN